MHFVNVFLILNHENQRAQKNMKKKKRLHRRPEASLAHAPLLLPLCFQYGVSCLKFHSFLIRHILTTNHTLYMATRNVIASPLQQNEERREEEKKNKRTTERRKKCMYFDRNEKKQLAATKSKYERMDVTAH